MCGCVAGGDYESVTPAVVVVGKESVDSVDQAGCVVSFKYELSNICIPSVQCPVRFSLVPQVHLVLDTYSSCYNSDYKPPQS